MVWVARLLDLLSFIVVLYPLYVFFARRAFERNADVEQISGLIARSARAYLMTQARTVMYVVLPVALLLSLYSACVARWLVIGALVSNLCSQLAMRISVSHNSRVVYAARDDGAISAMREGVRSGVITGITVAWVAVTIVSIVSASHGAGELPALGLCMGSALMSMFAKLGGGIFTKGADVGADLVGKIEKGLPEDDIRNPAVIADNVGDNVGDCAGASTDIFESSVVAMCAALAVARGAAGCTKIAQLLVGSVYVVMYLGVVGAVCGAMYVLRSVSKLEQPTDVVSLMYRGVIYSAVCTVILSSLYAWSTLSVIGCQGCNLPCLRLVLSCLIAGCALNLLVMYMTKVYTDSRYAHVQGIMSASNQGHGTNVIEGLALGLKYPLMPCLSIVIGVLGVWLVNPRFDLSLIVAMMGVCMLSQSGIVLVLDMYGPVTDNAGGLAEMTGLDDARKSTDLLDAAGNTIKAMTKGYSLVAMIFTAMSVVSVYASYLREVPEIVALVQGSGLRDVLSNIVGMSMLGAIVGSAVVYTFAGYAMQAVRIAGSSVVDEVRAQLAANPGIIDGSVQPDYQKTITALTQYSLRAMIYPIAALCVIPMIVLCAVYCGWGVLSVVVMLSGILAGVIVTGIPLAMSMNSSGAAWDNAKKAIEARGDKGSAAHSASVTGDTVGDPYKDTAGPAMNSAIKFVCVASLLFVAFYAAHATRNTTITSVYLA
jgi:K(+)-stimulated pyrophosphate-energized sodium pump